MIQIKYWISKSKVKLVFIKLGPIYLVTIYLLYEWFYEYFIDVLIIFLGSVFIIGFKMAFVQVTWCKQPKMLILSALGTELQIKP